MTLSETITQNMKEAMKAKDNATLSTLRLLRSAIKNKQIDLQHELTDEEIQAVIKTQVKQLQDSLTSFREAGRTEMADGVEMELTILKAYLPEELSDEALKAIVEQAITESGVTSKADMGQAMGAAMRAVAGRADGNRVKAFVQQLLPVLVLGVLVLPRVSSAAIPLFTSEVSTATYLETGLRMFRVLILWFGVIGVMSLLQGGFEYMVASMRDGAHTSAIQKMTQGFLATMIVAILFSLATVYLSLM